MTRTANVKGLVCVAACVLAAGIVLFAVSTRPAAGDQQEDRPPRAVGGFYPPDPQALREQVQKYLQEANPDVPEELRRSAPGAPTPRALIVPHAGYVFSGGTAGYAYKLLQGRPKPSRVILIGPSHYAPLAGVCSTDDFTHYVTPLGKVPVDLEARKRLLETPQVRLTQAAYAPEHCLEVQLPFLQTLWPEPPAIVPILVQELDAAQCGAAAAAVAAVLDEDSLVIVSTDFTHYGPRFGFYPFLGVHGSALAQKIRELDMEGVKHILALDPSGFRDYQSRTGATICGHPAVSIALELFSRSDSCRAVFLHWANSGEATHDYEDCVSYVAAAIYAPPGAVAQIKNALAEQRPKSPAVTEGPAYAGPTLGEPDKRLLLKLARAAVAAAVDPGATAPRLDLEQMPEPLRGKCGAFVTLRKQGELRGCIGHIEADRSLCVTVCQMAVLAAREDPRFPALTKEELPQVSIEISALGPLQSIKGLDEISVGRDGLVVSRGLRRGLLLPQVATEQKWTAQQFLEYTCLKAGLPADAWQEGGVRIERFAATVFGEEELGPP